MKVWNYNLATKDCHTSIDFHRNDVDSLLAVYEAVAAQVTQAARKMDWRRVGELTKPVSDLADAIAALTAEPTLKEVIEEEAE